MSDQQGGAEKFALTLVGVLVALTVAGVLALGVYRGMGGDTPQPGLKSSSGNVSNPAGQTPDGAVGTRGETTSGTAAAAAAGVEQVFFGVGDTYLPTNAGEVIARVAAAAQAQPSAQVRVSGFHDATGDASRNETLARERAQQVAQALETQGVSRERIVLSKPEATTGGSDPSHARRVDIRLD